MLVFSLNKEKIMKRFGYNNRDDRSKHAGRQQSNYQKSYLSYGIILFDNQVQPNVLLIQRKDSFGYMACIENSTITVKDVSETLATITTAEKNKLLQFDWDQLWADCFPNNKNMSLKQECKTRFEWLGIRDTVKALDDRGEQWKIENQWGLPKGRMSRVDNENGLRCALRELEEETGIRSNDIDMATSLGTLNDEYIGTDGNIYKSIYYIGKIKSEFNKPFSANSEVRSCDWNTTEQCNQRLSETTRQMITDAKTAIALPIIKT